MNVRYEAVQGPTDDEVTEFGFKWGPMVVSRWATLPRGNHVLGVQTKRAEVQLYVTRTGLIRVFKGGKELKAP